MGSFQLELKYNVLTVMEESIKEDDYLQLNTFSSDVLAFIIQISLLSRNLRQNVENNLCTGLLEIE